MGEGRSAIVATERSAGGLAAGWRLSGKVGGRALATLCVAAAASLAMPAGVAQAKPKPTLSQARAQLQKLNSQADHQDDAYNKAASAWKAAQKKLQALNKSVAQQQKTYEQMRERVAQMAVSAYKTGDNGTIPELLSAKDPEAVLDQMAAFTQLARNRSTELSQFLNAAQLLERQKAEAQQAAQDLAQKKKAALAAKKKIEKSVAKQKRLIASLGGDSFPGGSSGVTGSGCGRSYNGPATGWARTVLQYAFSKLCDPYVYGAAGPSSFDCSGLTMMAYKQIGYSLSHYVPDQWSETERVAKSDLAPGDLVFFDDNSHVGIYIGGDQFIHAPHTGSYVKIDSLNNSWYSSHYDGAGKPKGM